MSLRGLACSLVLSSAAPSAAAVDWTMDPAASHLEFVASFQQAAAPGEFKEFDTQFHFEPDQIGDSRLDVTIKVTSADMQNAEINDAIKTPVWFDFPGFPVSEFHATAIERADATHFVAHGSLNLKGVAHALDVPFTWRQSGDHATMTGQFTVARAIFDIGTGEWTATDIIGADVKVSFTVALKKRL